MRSFLLAMASIFLLAAPTSLSAETMAESALTEKLAVTQAVFEQIQSAAYVNVSVSKPKARTDECLECLINCADFPQPTRTQCEAWCYATIPACSF